MTDTKQLTASRGKDYGSPIEHFSTTQSMYQIWIARRESACWSGIGGMEERAFRHAVYMILDKLSRAANNPMHKDNLDDIQGYSRCAKIVLGLEE